MADRKPNEVKLIAWHLVAKNLVKFVNDDKSYKLTDKVIAANDFTKYPLSKGTSVEVGIVDDTITYLRKQKSEAKGTGSEEAYEPTAAEEAGTVEPEKPKAPAPAEANPPIVDGGVRELTVFAVAANKKVVKFLEVKDAGWFQIDETIQAQDYAVIGLQAKNKVSVKIVENGVNSEGKTIFKIVSLAKVASEPAEQPKTATSSPANAKFDAVVAKLENAPTQAPKKEWKSSSSYDNDGRQKSIEAQAAVNAASNVAAHVAAAITTASKKEDGTTNAPTANVINNIIRSIAESNFALIQELKSK